MPKNAPFELGWEEWLSLPDLGLPAIKAKIDTGAKTSALHASVIEPFGPPANPQVRFLIQPDPNDPSLEVTCSAPVVDRREVTSSNGVTELRYVIETVVEMGTRRFPIQLTLSNRETMTYRMLFGRGAIQPDMVVDANESFRMPELSYDLYKGLPKKTPVKRPLRIALLTREPNNYSSRRLVEAARARGHVIETIDTARCYMQIGTLYPTVHYDGKALPRYDAVIPRIGAKITDYGMAVLRQFSNTGAFCLNGAGSIGRSRDKLLAQQLLARANIAMPVTAFAHSPKDTKDLIDLVDGTPVVLKLLTSTQGRGVVLAETRKAAESLVDAFRGLDADFLVQEFVAEAAGADVRAFVIGNKVVGAMKRQAQKGEFRSNLHRGGTASNIRLTAAERDTAREAAKVLGLNVAGVDLLQTSEGPKVLEVNSSPGLEGIEKATGKDIAALIIQHVERQVRPLSRDREALGRPSRRINVN
ncbi:MAG: 30S ribosomal protein S6--L-glutamate ligase [Hyphomonas sp.]|uniref:30S ribosomal protein S6--L-glutamate ligase n=1 Tax=Hyphomonas sp. TaxID=87 RepID=UPI003529AC07